MLAKNFAVNALQNFVRWGIIGDLRLGIQRQDVELRLGRPKTWLGKPPCFGPAIQTPEESDAWGYYDGSVSVGFGSQGVVTTVTILPEHIRNEVQAFLALPIRAGLTMGQFRDLLVESQIDFDEGEDNEPGGYYILAERRCTATGIPFQHGKRVNELKRVVMMIQTVLGDDHLPPFVLRYWKSRPEQST